MAKIIVGLILINMNVFADLLDLDGINSFILFPYFVGYIIAFLGLREINRKSSFMDEKKLLKVNLAVIIYVFVAYLIKLFSLSSLLTEIFLIGEIYVGHLQLGQSAKMAEKLSEREDLRFEGNLPEKLCHGMLLAETAIIVLELTHGSHSFIIALEVLVTILTVFFVYEMTLFALHHAAGRQDR